MQQYNQYANSSYRDKSAVQARQVAYARQLTDIQAELDRVRQVAADTRMEEEQQAELAQRRKDLDNVKALTAPRRARRRRSYKGTIDPLQR